MSLKRSAVTGVKWTAISSFASTGIQLAQAAVLARLLEPSDFGLMAMVALVLNLAEQYVDVGISNAIIHRQESFSDELSSFYWLNISIGCATFVVIVLATPLVSIFFQEPRLNTLIPIAALVFLIAPFGSQFQILLQKELDFRTGAIIALTKTAVGATVAISAAGVSAGVAISAAYVGYGVLSLIFGQVASVSVATALYIFRGRRLWSPTFRFRRADLSGFLGFGFYQMGERTLNFVASRADQILIGALLGSQTLGYYSFAWNLIVLPVTRINPILTQVAFPLFAKVQDETERLVNGYLMLSRALSTINAPILLGLAATAPTLIPIIYGKQWMQSVFLVQVLAGVGLLRSLLNPMGTLLLAKGRADLGFFWDLCVVLPQLSVVAIALYFVGVTGVVYSLLLLHIAYFFLSYWYVIRRLVGSCFSQYAGSTLGPVAIAGVMAICVWFSSRYIGDKSALSLLVETSIGASVYIILSLLLQRAWLREVRSFWQRR
jgi:lipopolysaccharide exporter